MKKSYKELYEKQSLIARELYEQNVILKKELNKEKNLNDLLLEKIYKVGGNEDEIIKRRIRGSKNLLKEI